VSTESKLKAVRLHSVFGPPPLLEGEDAAAYDEFYGRVCAALKPADVIEEMLVADLVGLEWELLRWRRFESSLIQARGLNESNLTTICTANISKTILPKSCNRILRGTRPKTLRGFSPMTVPGINRAPSTRSTRYSTVSGPI
jgi:hypothetical protein